MTYSKTSKQKENPVALIFRQIRAIQLLSRDASKPVDNKIIYNKIEKIVTDLKENKERSPEIGKWLLEIFEPNLIPITPEIQESAKIYGDYFKIEVYRKLLPYTQIAYAFEQNGSPEEHALKLSVLFKDTQSALDYLNKKIQQASLHDACLFVIPDTSQCTFPIWQDLAKKYIHEELFQNILAQACEIEDLIKTDCEEAKKSKKKTNWDEIITLQKTIKQDQAAWKKLKTNVQERDKNLNKFNELSKIVLQNREQLTHLRGGVPLDKQMDLLTLQCYQERYIKEAGPAYQYLLSKGLTRKDYKTFVSLDRTQAGKNIPDVTIDGSDLNYPGFYLKKIQVQVDEEAARAACLGKLTGCCQSLSGAGESCTIHGLTSPYGGFYILCKGDVNKPTISDPLIAQCWAWRSNTNSIVFDSIEMNIKEYSLRKMVVNFYRHLGKSLCLGNETNKVYCGATSGISEDVGILEVSNPEIPKDYIGYSDSKKQMFIFDKERPWYLFDKDKDAKDLTQSVVIAALTSQKPLEESKYLFEMLNWVETCRAINAQYTIREVEKYIKITLDDKKDELNSLIKNMSNFFNTPLLENENIEAYENKECYIHAIDSSRMTLLMRAVVEERYDLFERLIKKGAPISVIDDKGNTLQHYIVTAQNPNFFKVLLDHLIYPNTLGMNKTITDPLQVLQVQGYDGKTLLHDAVKSFQSLNTVLESFSKDAVLEALQIRDSYKRIPLFYACKTPESFKRILVGLYSEKEQLQALQVRDSGGKTLMHEAVETPESLKIMLELYSKEQILQALECKELSGNVPLFYAHNTPESIKLLLEIYLEKDRLQIIKRRNGLGGSILLGASDYSKSLKVIFHSLPEPDRLQVIQDLYMLYRCSYYSNHKSLKVLLDFINPKDILHLIQMNDGERPSALHSGDEESFDIIFNSLPEGDHLVAVQVKDHEGIMALYNRKVSDSKFKILFSQFPEQDRLKILQATDKKGRTIFDSTFRFSLFKDIFALLPEQDRLPALQIQYQGQWLLHYFDVQTRITLLTILPEQDRLLALSKIKLRNYYSYGKYWYCSISDLLTLLPEQDRLPALSNIHLSNYFGEFELKAILNTLPEKDRLQVFQSQQGKGYELNFAIHEPKYLSVLRETLPEADWVLAVHTKDSEGKTLLDYARQKNDENLLEVLTNNSYDKIQYEILDDLTEIIAMLDDSFYLDSPKLKMKALSDLKDLINNTDDCWTTKQINPKSYGDIFDYWSKQKQFKNAYGHELTNLEMVNLKRNVFSTLFSPTLFGARSGDAVKLLIEKYKDIRLPSFNQEVSKRLSI